MAFSQQQKATPRPRPVAGLFGASLGWRLRCDAHRPFGPGTAWAEQRHQRARRDEHRSQRLSLTALHVAVFPASPTWASSEAETMSWCCPGSETHRRDSGASKTGAWQGHLMGDSLQLTVLMGRQMLSWVGRLGKALLQGTPCPAPLPSPPLPPAWLHTCCWWWPFWAGAVQPLDPSCSVQLLRLVAPGSLWVF